MKLFPTQQPPKLNVEFDDHGVRISFIRGGKPLDLTKDNERHGLARHNKRAAESLAKLESACGQLDEVPADYSFSSEDRSYFSDADLRAHSLELTASHLFIAYKTIAAVRFFQLEDKLGVSPNDLTNLGVPNYLQIRTKVTVLNNFGDPNFKLALQYFDTYGRPLFLGRKTGHHFDFGAIRGLVHPQVARLAQRIEEHLSSPNRGSSADEQRKDFAEIRAIAEKAYAQVDQFLAELNLVFIEKMPYEFQKGADGSLSVAPVMPLGYEDKDYELQTTLADKFDEMRSHPLLALPRTGDRGERLVLVLSPEAKTDLQRIKALNQGPQTAIAEALEDPQSVLGSLPRIRTPVGDTFSTRVVDFVFGRQPANRSDYQDGAQWGSGYEDCVSVIRSTQGIGIPITYYPMPSCYEEMKQLLDDALKEERKLAIERTPGEDFIFTPTPELLKRQVSVPSIGHAFTLTELQECCKRIEIQNQVEIAVDSIESSEALIAEALAAGRKVLNWTDTETNKSCAIPVESVRRGINKHKASSQSESVSPVISEITTTLGTPPSWDWTRANYDEYKSAPRFRQEVTLRRHQRIGYAWLRWILEHKTVDGGKKGALLADDMGLGKTIQILSLISHLKHSPDLHDRPILIVAPVSLIRDSWVKDGFEQFLECDWVRNNVFLLEQCPIKIQHDALLAELRRVSDEINQGGKALAECEISADLRSSLDSFVQWTKAKILVTSYERLRSNSVLLAAVPFSLVVLDEAQKIKNLGALQSNAAKALKAEMAIAMTGTPIENSLVDLWGIMDFVLPGHLPSLQEFKENFVTPVKSLEPGTQKRNELRKNLEQALRPIWLRRTKSEVFKGTNELPAIHHFDSICDETGTFQNIHAVQMSQPQKAIYDEFMGIFMHSAGGHRLASIRGLLESCSAPWLKADIAPTWSNSETLFQYCPKLRATMDILAKIRNGTEEQGRKVVIFANIIEIQNHLAYLIADWNRSTTGHAMDVEVYNGESSPKVRSEILDRFKKAPGFKVVIISPRAGGAGLNICEANHVIHYTREWNPALEKQATDRVYRIGQKREVHVYYPTTVAASSDSPTAEEHLASILRAKRGVMEDFTVSLSEMDISADSLSSGFASTNTEASDSIRITAMNVDSLDPKLFEGLVAAIFSKSWKTVTVVGGSRDRGADVVCVSDGKGLLIQAKHSSVNASQGTAGINQVRGARSVYQQKFGAQLDLAVITNSTFSADATLLAYQQGDKVELIDRSKLGALLEIHPITIGDIRGFLN